MHFVIMGSGRVGAVLATLLDQEGHSVAVIDKTSEAFRRLPKSFSGRRITGLGFDRDALQQADIEDAYAFAAVSNGDNSNIIAARTAREVFGVERVVARIYDPRRAEVYQKLGIPTVGTVRRTTAAVLQWITPSDPNKVFEEETGVIEIVGVIPDRGWIGHSFSLLERLSQSRVAYFNRLGGATIPNKNSVVQENDELFVAVRSDNKADSLRCITRPPELED